MFVDAWIQVGRIAVVLTLATVTLAAVSDAEGGGESLATFLGVAGFVTWAVWTFGALNVAVQSGGTETVYQHPSIAILGVVLALVPGYIALTGPFEVVARARDGDLRDV